MNKTDKVDMDPWTVLMVVIETLGSISTRDTIGALIRGMGAVAIQSRVYSVPATGNPEKLVLTLGGGGAGEGV